MAHLQNNIFSKIECSYIWHGWKVEATLSVALVSSPSISSSRSSALCFFCVLYYLLVQSYIIRHGHYMKLEWVFIHKCHTASVCLCVCVAFQCISWIPFAGLFVPLACFHDVNRILLSFVALFIRMSTSGIPFLLRKLSILLQIWIFRSTIICNLVVFYLARVLLIRPRAPTVPNSRLSLSSARTGWLTGIFHDRSFIGNMELLLACRLYLTRFDRHSIVMMCHVVFRCYRFS